MAKQVTKAKQLKSDYMGDYCDECGDEKALCQCLQDLSTGLYIHESKITALVGDMDRYARRKEGKSNSVQRLTTAHWRDRLKQLLEG